MVLLERQLYYREPYRKECSLSSRKIVQYDLMFDSEKYKALATLKRFNPEVYAEKKKALNRYTSFNLETALGERYNCGLSNRRDEIKDGQIYGRNSDEPLIAMFERGRDYRKQYGSSPEDQRRESAEVNGFKKIQEVLCNPEAEVGTIMISISPPGGETSIYKHNFYDVFTLQKEENGEKYIDARRYSSALTSQEYAAKMRELSPTNPVPFQSDAEYFLSNPITINSNDLRFETADEIHQYFHKEHGALSSEDMQKIIADCQPVIRTYKHHIAEHPDDMGGHEINFQAILKIADMKADELSGKPKDIQLARYEFQYVKGRADQQLPVIPPQVMRYLGTQEVRRVNTGCGPSGGKRTEKSSGTSGALSILGERQSNSPFSVADFGKAQDEYGDLSFECPSCHRLNTRPSGKLLSKCQHCESSEVSCEEVVTGE